MEMASPSSDGDQQPGLDASSSSSNPISRDSNMATKLQNAPSLTVKVLQEITDNFSEERKIGQGAYGTVYKGMHPNGEEMAVKLLHNNIQGTEDGQFKREFENLMRLEHHNIVRIVGYCYETQHKPMLHKGETIFAEEIKRALCFEYMQNGSLQKHISEEHNGLDWHTRYKIIKGTCEGLNYLHEGFSEPIYHMDLKPDNILLDENMTPKLADFGLSKLYDGEQSMVTKDLMGTIGYLPPEYLFEHIVSKKLDIFSLGVVMTKIITGPRGPSRRAEMTYEGFIDQIHANWRKRLQETWRVSEPLEAYCKQVNICIEMALRCMETDRHKRPNIGDIIHKLNDTETAINELKNDQGHRWTSVCYKDLGELPRQKEEDLGKLRSMPRPHDLGFISKLRTIYRDNVHDLIIRPWAIASFKRHKIKRNNQSNISENRSILVDMAHTEEPRKGTERAPRASATRFNWEYTLAQLKAATKGFAPEAKIGEGRLGMVYRGKLLDGREVAIKRGKSPEWMARRFQQNENAFWSELDFLSRLHHKHLVGLVGYCEENDERLLVYVYMKNGSLYDHLHPKPGILDDSWSSPVLSSWKLRIKILLDASRGIEYLHMYAVPPIIHRDIKSSNILLDGSWVAHMSDFGLSLLAPPETEEPAAAGAQVQHLRSKIAGTVGYVDPEYYRLNHLTAKSDVYGFGVVMLEALTGKRAIFKEAKSGKPMSLVDYAQPSIVAGELGKVLDGRAPEPTTDEAEAVELVAYTAVHCVGLEGKDRPVMADIVANLGTAFALCNGCK